MARTHELHDVTESGTANADAQAFCEAAALRKYRIVNGQVVLFSDGKLFPVPAPVGFAGLDPAIRPLVAQALLQFVQNRIGQKAGSGMSAADMAVKAIAEGEVSNAQTNDAYEAAYRHGITARIEAKVGALPEDADTAAKKDRAEAIAATMVKHRDALFDTIIAECVAAGQEAGTASEKTRKTKVASTAKAFDLV